MQAGKIFFALILRYQKFGNFLPKKLGNFVNFRVYKKEINVLIISEILFHFFVEKVVEYKSTSLA